MHRPELRGHIAKHRFAWVFVTCLVLFVGLGELWSLATPLNGAPDERAHIIKAAAVVRGQWLGARIPGAPAYTVDHVPEVYASIGTGDCVVGRPTTPEGTCPFRPTTAKVVNAPTYVGHYPPLYYLLVGWPSLLDTRSSIFLIRLMSTVVNSVFLALAVAAACRWSRSLLLIPGLAVAITPAVIFFMGVVNPSSLEISAGVAMWTSAAILVSNGPKYQHSRGLLAILTAAACVEILVRGDSFVWVLCCAAVLAPMAFGGVALSRDAIRFSRYIAFPLLLASGTAAGVWMVVGKPLTVVPLNKPAPGTSEVALIGDIFGHSGGLAREMIGVFGWVDTPSPSITYLVWYAVVGAIVIMAILIGSGRHLASLALAIGATLAVPFALLNLAIRNSGPLFQGRYFLALAVGIPIVAGCVSTQTGRRKKPAATFSIAVVALTSLAQIAAGYWALRRYLVGSNGPLLPTSSIPGAWRPPVPAWLTDVGFVALWCVLAYLAVRFVRSYADAPTSDPVGLDSTAIAENFRSA